MSFDGFYRILCKNGHLHSRDCYTYDESSWKCPDCNEVMVWEELIDQTNGYDPHDEYNLELVEEQVVEECKCCGTQKLVRPARYKIPTPEDTEVFLNEEEIIIAIEQFIAKEHPDKQVQFVDMREDDLGGPRAKVTLKRK